MTGKPLSWFGIVRLGLVQAALGAVIVIATSTMNRIMVVEFSFPAILPGALVALHYFVQMIRPRMGHGSDVGGRRTPWIIGGMAVLATGGIAAAGAITQMAAHPVGGILMAIAAYTVIGIGAGASGTSLLALLAKLVDPRRRAAAATIVWIMMIAGLGVTATIAGQKLDPFSPDRLLAVTATIAAIAFGVTVLTLWGVEGDRSIVQAPSAAIGAPKPSFSAALAQIWAEPQARGFTIFVFISMLAYSAQELILEPFAGAVFALSPGESTKLTGMQHGGAVAGMILVAVLATLGSERRLGSMRNWCIGGCAASAVALLALAAGSLVGPAWPLKPCVFLLGVANGTFTVAAIGSMMTLAGAGGDSRQGIRMGIWGAAQAVAFACGGVVGTLSSDLMRYLFGSPIQAYAMVFAGEAVLFIYAAAQATRVFGPTISSRQTSRTTGLRDLTPAGEALR
jgi:BCD family chlorophyll transporter-like MFS transporter